MEMAMMQYNRRQLLNHTVVGAAAGVTVITRIAAAATPGIKAIAFDGFVIFDPRPVAALAERLFPGRGADLSNTWRTRQFEYTWLRTLSESYVDFRRVTEEALIFACKLLNLELTPEKRDQLTGALLQLKAWPDILPTLTTLKNAGIRMAFLSDLPVDMLDANVRSAGLEGFFGEHLSTDRVSAFKPDPRAYRMGVEVFGLDRREIAVAAFSGWAAAGTT